MLSYRLAAMLLVGGALGLAPAARAADWVPTKNVEMTVGAGAGGAVDLLARVLQKNLEAEKLVPSMTVVNKPGAGFTAAISYVASHPGDAHYVTLLGSGWVTTAVQEKRPENFTNVVPVAKVFDTPMVFGMREDSPIRTAQDMVTQLKKDPGSLRFAITTSAGNFNHLGALELGDVAGVDIKKMRVIVNDAGGVSISQLLGGHIEVCVCSLGIMQPLVQAKTGRVIGLASDERWDQAPEVPTMKEQGVPVSIVGLYIFALPKGATPEQVAFWDKAIQQAIKTADVKKVANDQKVIVQYIGGEPLKKFLADQTASVSKKLSSLGLIPN